MNTIEIWEYFPRKSESISDCINRVNSFFKIDKCPFNIDILDKIIKEGMGGLSLDYYNERYKYYEKTIIQPTC